MKISLFHVLLVISLAGIVQADTAFLYQNQSDITVVINEMMASNNNTKPDPQLQFDDWIEIYNYGSDEINIGGFYLTDNLSNPNKWPIPDGTTISARGYLLIWADGDIDDTGLHADFKLDVEGEEIGLFEDDGKTLIDSVVFPAQTTDFSYGRYPDAAQDWRFFNNPSPAAQNQDGYLGEVEAPEFSHSRGFYDESFYLTMASETKGAVIRYTTDGSVPTKTSGRIYLGPIHISTTTPLRAIAIKSGWKPSEVKTHTYVFLDDVIRQSPSPEGFPTRWGNRVVDYAMDKDIVEDPSYSGEIKDDLLSTPSVCIVIPNDDFFGDNGIYANPTQKGDNWEREASMEWIDPGTGEHFGVNAGLRIQGGDYARGRLTNPKSGLQFFFRGEYGLSKLEYPLFPDTDVLEFDRLALREIWNYSWIGDSGGYGADYLRDTFCRDTVRDMGRLTPYGRPVQVYINGLYWGLYIMTERIDNDFAADHLGGDKEDYDVLEAPSNQGGSTNMKVASGDETTALEAWDTLFALADSDLTNAIVYEAFLQYLDLPAMIDYMLMIYYVGSRDAPVFLGDQRTPRNFYALRSRESEGPFLFVPWDVEWCLENPQENRVGIVGVWQPHYLMAKLAINDRYRMLLADRIHRQFYNEGPLTRDKVNDRYITRTNEIYGAIVGESARWGDVKRSQPYTREDWEREIDRLVNQFFSGRTETVISQLRQAGFYPNVSAPSFYFNGQYQHGGYTGSSGTISIVKQEGTIWFTIDGSDPLLPDTIMGSSENITLVSEDAEKRALVPTEFVSTAWRSSKYFNDRGWISGYGGIGYDTGTEYSDYFDINI
ncbi:MAG: CotH kinase family protein, partial [Sedimentisphaerales bacterium]|nr:CotH kinase family protein [Sedimentisphaerales bacterium]